MFLYKQLNKENKVLLIFFLTPIIIITILSLFSRANANWAAVGFPFGIIFLANIVNDSEEKFKKYYIFFSQFLLSLVIILLILLGQNNIKLDPFSKQRHARDLALHITEELKNIENVAFMADDREDYAIMLFYIKSFKVKKQNGMVILKLMIIMSLQLMQITSKDTIYCFLHEQHLQKK